MVSQVRGFVLAPCILSESYVHTVPSKLPRNASYPPAHHACQLLLHDTIVSPPTKHRRCGCAGGPSLASADPYRRNPPQIHHGHGQAWGCWYESEKSLGRERGMQLSPGLHPESQGGPKGNKKGDKRGSSLPNVPVRRTSGGERRSRSQRACEPGLTRIYGDDQNGGISHPLHRPSS